MRLRLADLDPAWLSSGVTNGRQGFDFLCPCGRHRVAVWLLKPPDGSEPVTATAGRPLYEHEGDDFDTMWVPQPILCGADLLFIYAGEVTVSPPP